MTKLSEAPEAERCSQCGNGNRGRRHQLGSATRAHLRHPLRHLVPDPVGQDHHQIRLAAPHMAAADFQFATAWRMPGVADDNGGFVSTT